MDQEPEDGSFQQDGSFSWTSFLLGSMLNFRGGSIHGAIFPFINLEKLNLFRHWTCYTFPTKLFVDSIPGELSPGFPGNWLGRLGHWGLFELKVYIPQKLNQHNQHNQPTQPTQPTQHNQPTNQPTNQSAFQFEFIQLELFSNLLAARPWTVRPSS